MYCDIPVGCIPTPDLRYEIERTSWSDTNQEFESIMGLISTVSPSIENWISGPLNEYLRTINNSPCTRKTLLK